MCIRDRHGTAVITLAGVINALKLVGKKLDEVKIVTSGAGAAGIAIIKLLMSMASFSAIEPPKKTLRNDSLRSVLMLRNTVYRFLSMRSMPCRIKGVQILLLILVMMYTLHGNLWNM